MPQDLRDEVRNHKADLIGLLVHYEPSGKELMEIQTRINREGFVLLWSTVLADTVAFVHTDADKLHVPVGFTVYTLGELKSLFGNEQLSRGSLRLIHDAKKYGGRVVDKL